MHNGTKLGLLAGGATQTEVARRFNVADSTITRLVTRVNATETTAERPRPGQPRVTSVRQDHYIRQRHLRNRFATAQSTANAIVGNRGRSIHRETVINRLRERVIYCRRPARCQALTQRHRLERQRWALNNRRRQWDNVVFSDESRFNIHHADGRVRIYRCRNERFANICVRKVYPYGGWGVMVWAAINTNFKSDLVVCNDNLNARRYIDQILRPHVVPIFRRRQGLMFMHDNARPHTAIVTRHFLQQNNVRCYNGQLVPLIFVIRLSICGTSSVAGYVNVPMPLIPSTSCHRLSWRNGTIFKGAYTAICASP